MKIILYIVLSLLIMTTWYSCGPKWEGIRTYSVSIVTDSNDIPYILYGYHTFNSSLGNLKVAYGSGEKWNYLTITTGQKNWEPDNWGPDIKEIAVDTRGEPEIIYSTPTEWVFYNMLSGFRYSSSTLDASQPSFRFDSNNVPHVAYLTYSSTTSSYTYTLNYAVLNGTGWSVTAIDREYGLRLYLPLLLISDSEVPNIIYLNVDNNNTLNYTTFNAGLWISNTIDTSVNAANMVLDSSSKPIIVYLQDNALKLATYQGSGFITQTITNSSNCQSRTFNTQNYLDALIITLDTYGNPKIACVTNDFKVGIFSFDGSAWNTNYTTPINNSTTPVLVFDHNENIHTAYGYVYKINSSDPFNDNYYRYHGKGILKYGFWSGMSWTMSAVN
jgi:hypothetical protein